MSFEPIQIDMEVAESEQTFEMEVAEQIVVNPSSCVKLAEDEFTIAHASTTASLVGSINIDPPSDAWRSDKIILVSVRDKAGKRNGYFLGGDFIFENPRPAENSGDTSFTAAAKVVYCVDSDGHAVLTSTAYGVFANDININGRIRIYARYHSSYSLTIDGTYKIEVYALQYPNNVSPFV